MNKTGFDLHGDNPESEIQHIKFSDVLEVWEAKGIFSKAIKRIAAFSKRIAKLEKVFGV